MMDERELKSKKIIDDFLGEYGFTIWILPLGIMMFLYFLYIGVSGIAKHPPRGAENILFFIIYIVSISSVISWFSYQALSSLNIIQEIKLSNNNINVVFYFRKKLNINISDIASVSLLDKNSFLLKKHRAVQTDKPCLQIKTKDSQSYLITPHMERFDELKVALDKLVKEHN